MIRGHAFVPKDDDRNEFICRVCNEADEKHFDIQLDAACQAEFSAGIALYETLNRNTPDKDELIERIRAARRYVLAAEELKELL